MWKCPKCGREFKSAEQNHFCAKPSDIDEYIAAQPENVRPLLQSIREIIREAVPESVEKISWQMPTFWMGKNIIHFAAFKKHIGLYPGSEAIEYFSDHLTEYKTSKGAIQLPYDKPLPLPLIAEITKWCYMTRSHH